MTWRDESDFERELTAGLERLAPRPRRDSVQQAMAAVERTEQRGGWRVLAARAGIAVDWPRLAKVGGVAAAALVVGIVIGTSGLLPSGGDATPTPNPSASQVPGGWQEPPAYSFVMVASCGERSLLGRFGVTVEGGVTVAYEALDEQAGLFGGPPDEIPTLGGMLRLVAGAREGGVADVMLVTDPIDGHPVEVRIDWLPNAIDDEECYLVSDYAPASSPSVQPSSTPTAGWGALTIQPVERPGDIVVQDGYAWHGGAVLTGQLAGPLAEERGGVEPLAWFSRDGVSWLPAGITLPASGITAFDIGPVLEVDGRLLAFGTGEIDASGESSAVLFESTDDGATWQALDQRLPPGAFISDAIAFHDQFVAVGYTPDTPSRAVVWTSPDGVAWEETRLEGEQGPLYGVLSALATDGSRLVAVGPTYAGLDGQPTGESLITSDGVTWTVGEAPPGGDALMRDVVHHASSFIAVGAADGKPAVWWSGDGFSWRSIEIDAPSGVRMLSAVGVSDDGVAAVGDGADHAVAWRSISGQRWEPGDVLGTDAGLQVVLRTDAGTVVAGTTSGLSLVTGKQPVAWITPPAGPLEP